MNINIINELLCTDWGQDEIWYILCFVFTTHLSSDWLGFWCYVQTQY